MKVKFGVLLKSTFVNSFKMYTIYSYFDFTENKVY